MKFKNFSVEGYREFRSLHEWGYKEDADGSEELVEYDGEIYRHYPDGRWTYERYHGAYGEGCFTVYEGEVDIDQIEAFWAICVEGLTHEVELYEEEA